MMLRMTGLAALLVTLAAVVYLMEQGAAPGEPEKLLPGLQGRLSEVRALHVTSGTDPGQALNIRFADGAWLISEKADYPANFESLVELLDTLAALEIAELKTAKAENHGQLGLAAGGENAGMLVEITFEDDSLSVLIGNRSGNRGTFVRYPDDNQVYLVSGQPRVSTDPMEWIDDVIHHVDSSEIRKVSIVQPDGSALTAERDDSGNLAIADLPEGAELKYETIVDGLGRLLTNPRFLDVQPLYEPAFVAATRTQFVLSSGEMLTARTVKLGEGYWLHLDHGTAAGWQYEVSEYTFKEFNKTLDDLLKSPADDE